MLQVNTLLQGRYLILEQIGRAGRGGRSADQPADRRARDRHTGADDRYPQSRGRHPDRHGRPAGGAA